MFPTAGPAWSRRLLIGADEVIVVAAPDLANLRNAKNILDVLKAARPNDAAPKLVLNGVGLPKRPEISPADFAKSLELQPTAVVPFDAKLFGTAANNGQMIGEVEAGNRDGRDLDRTGAGRHRPERASRRQEDALRALSWPASPARKRPDALAGAMRTERFRKR